jgi:hypothetical protein
MIGTTNRVRVFSGWVFVKDPQRDVIRSVSQAAFNTAYPELTIPLDDPKVKSVIGHVFRPGEDIFTTTVTRDKERGKPYFQLDRGTKSASGSARMGRCARFRRGGGCSRWPSCSADPIRASRNRWSSCSDRV